MGRKSNTAEFIKKAKQIYGDAYDYSRVNYLHNEAKVIIVCRKHGEFQQQPTLHLDKRGRGCPTCGREKIAEGRRKTQDSCIERFKKVHGNRYDYSKVKYKNSGIYVEIICKKHGSFMQTPDNHYKGAGCRECAKKTMGTPLKTTEQFIADAQKIHGDRYSYEKSIYTGWDKSIIITCDKHGDFKTSPNNHLNGRHCAKCRRNGTSFICDKWLDSLNVKVREHWIPNTSYKVDGFDPVTNTVYEYCGLFWHGHPKYFNPQDINPANGRLFGDLFKETIERFKTLKSLGYNLRVKWENSSRHKRICKPEVSRTVQKRS